MGDKFDLMYNVEAARKLTEMELKEDGIKEGIEQGIQEGKKEIIQDLINKGKSLKEISNFLEISESDLKKLLEETNE